MSLTYTLNSLVQFEEVLDLLERAGRPVSEDEARRLCSVRPDTNLVIACRDGQHLVGLARGLKELNGCCYLSDLLVDPSYQQSQNVGETLIRRAGLAAGEHSLVVLVPVEAVPVEP